MLNTVALLYDPFLHIGGIETHLLSLLRYGTRNRYRWLVFALSSPTFQAQAEASGARVVPWRPAYQLDVAALIRLLHLLRVHSVNLVHAHSPRAAFFGRVAACLLGLPVVVTVHLPPYYYVRGQNARARCKRWLYRHIERVLNHRFSDRLIYVSSRVGWEAIECGLAPRERTTVVENGIDLAPFADRGRRQSLREALGASPATTVLCCVGRLAEQKGIDVLLEAFYALEPQKRELRLWLVGDGPLRAALETGVRQLGLEANVQFLGFRDDVPDLLMASDIFVLPSRYEAMPITVLEAMAAGLPCVVTDVGDNAELVEDSVAGRVVPPEDPAALAAALSQLLTTPALRRAMGDAARQKAQHYTAERMVASTLAVYEQVLGRSLAVPSCAQGKVNGAEGPMPGGGPTCTLAAIIPAHDEALVIEGTVARLCVQMPLGAVFVVADNCTDDTAVVACRAGARVWERRQPDRPGKGAALRWFFENPQAELAGCTYVCIFDADSIVHRDFFTHIRRALESGAEVVQGFVQPVGFHTSVAATLAAYSEVLSQVLDDRLRARLGWSVPLRGTGMVFRTDLLRDLLLSVHTQTEDAELTLLLAERGIRVHFAPEAVVFDPKPPDAALVSRQRARWLRGLAQVWQDYRPLILRLLLRGPACWWLLQAVLLKPKTLLSALKAALLLGTLILPLSNLWRWAAAIWLLTDVLYYALGLILVPGADRGRYARALLLAPVYLGVWGRSLITACRHRAGWLRVRPEDAGPASS